MNYEQDPHNDEYEITISIHKPIFHISAVAQMIGIHQQTLRSYEKQGIMAILDCIQLMKLSDYDRCLI